jgi:hypothetical protein
MPVHDWTRVDDGTFHDFNLAWIAEIRKALNGGILPAGYYAQAEQVAGSIGPAVLTLQRPSSGNGGANGGQAGGRGGAVATMAPPRTSVVVEAEISEYTARQRSLIIRHVSRHRIVALVEILSPGNKASDYAFQSLLVKVGGALYHGIHLLLVDLHPPTPREPRGIHAAVWESLHAGSFAPPEDRPLTLVSYRAGARKAAFVEPVALGQELPAMPLFLEQGWHVLVPLESTYRAAWEGTRAFSRDILEAP